MESTQLNAPKPMEQESRRLRVVEHKKANSFSEKITLKAVLVFAFIVGTICLMLYNQAQINEVNNKINSVKSDIQQLESDYVRMHSSLESKISLRNVALKAEQELGLQKLDQYKTVHVRIYEEDQVELLETDEGVSISDHVETFVANAIHRIKSTFDAA